MIDVFLQLQGYGNLIMRGLTIGGKLAWATATGDLTSVCEVIGSLFL
jgi:hypothetical protein